MLDLVGPLTVFSLHSNIHLLWKTLDPVASDTGIAMVPTCTLQNCPSKLDVIFVPGGFGTADAIEDAELIEFLKDAAPRADYITSVCSGSLILGAAGLLEGYRAGTHWASRELLAGFGATAVAERVVTDRNRITGGGVTAGIDFGLVLLAKLRGTEVAQMVQLAMEYDPQPPFDTGSPEKASPAIVQQVRNLIEEVNSRTQLAVRG